MAGRSEIYICHDTKRLDYVNGLYIPLRKSLIPKVYTLILPHESSDSAYDSEAMFRENKDSMILLGEISFPSAGFAEIGMARILKIPIITFCRDGIDYSKSIRGLSKEFFTYKNDVEMISRLEKILFDNKELIS